MRLGPTFQIAAQRLAETWLMFVGENDGALEDGVVHDLVSGSPTCAEDAGECVARALLTLCLHQRLVAADASGNCKRSQADELLTRLEAIGGCVDMEWLSFVSRETAERGPVAFVNDVACRLDARRDTRGQLAGRFQCTIALYCELVALDFLKGSELAPALIRELRAKAVFA